MNAPGALSFPGRMVAWGYIALVDIQESATPIIISSGGIVSGIDVPETGVLRVALRDPGVANFLTHPPIVLATAIDVTFVGVTATFESPTLVRFTNDFGSGLWQMCFAILSTERAGGDPLPSPGT